MNKDFMQHNQPFLGMDEKKSVESIIESGWIAKGKKVEEFEIQFSNYFGLDRENVSMVNSGTSALYVALKHLDIKNGDKVLVPSYTCSALINAIYLIGAEPEVCDISKNSFNVDKSTIEEHISDKLKAMIIPHTFGFTSDIKSIKSYGIPIIEDCAQALGSSLHGKKAGLWGDISIFSFYASKVITTGNGGMILSKNENIMYKIKDYLDFDGREDYYPRFNFNPSDIEAALGVEQMKKIEKILKNRQIISNIYKDEFFKKGMDFFENQEIGTANNYRFVIKVKEKNVEKIIQHFLNNKIKTIVPIENWELIHNYLKLEKKNFINSEMIALQTISIPIYPQLLENGKVEKIVNAIRTI